ncbi:MAG: hypothetical protein OEL56_05320 [Nitrosopumilus sp.]|nr:hypothetical protein [Nitrosopumilus sp.]MDH3564681.1 hypothetical protein [Nitrosopumilus sp.]
MHNSRNVFTKNAEIIKEFYDAFKKQNKLLCLQYYDEKIEWIIIDQMSTNGSTYVGSKSIFEEYFPKMLSDFQPGTCQNKSILMYGSQTQTHTHSTSLIVVSWVTHTVLLL